MGTTRMLGRRDDGPAVFTYEAVPGVPPVSTIRFGRKLPPGGPPPRHAHSHDFLVLAYFERGDGSMWVRDREWLIEAGDGPAPGDAPAERPSWSERLSALDLELSQRQSGYQEAALAHLTLLLVGVGRLAVDVVGNLRFNDERLLAKVFGFIEDRYREPISLKDVARAVSLSPGHLTTVVRRKTGRTVQEWIAERRMAEARRLLVQTDLAVEELGQRVGYGDAGYFVRSFRHAHGMTPLGWRRAGRPNARISGSAPARLLTVPSRSLLRVKNAGFVLGVAANCS